MIEYRDLIGIPYSFLGRDTKGASCMWIWLELQRRAGREPLDPISDPDGASEQIEIVNAGPWWELDGLVIDEKGLDLGGHIAVVVGDGSTVLHATRDRGVIETGIERVESRVLFGYRWKRHQTA